MQNIYSPSCVQRRDKQKPQSLLSISTCFSILSAQEAWCCEEGSPASSKADYLHEYLAINAGGQENMQPFAFAVRLKPRWHIHIRQQLEWKKKKEWNRRKFTTGIMEKWDQAGICSPDFLFMMPDSKLAAEKASALLLGWAGGRKQRRMWASGGSYFSVYFVVLVCFLEVKDVWEGSGRDQLRKCLGFLRKTANPGQEVPNNTPTSTGYFYGPFWWLVYFDIFPGSWRQSSKQFR